MGDNVKTDAGSATSGSNTEAKENTENATGGEGQTSQKTGAEGEAAKSAAAAQGETQKAQAEGEKPAPKEGEGKGQAEEEKKVAPEKYDLKLPESGHLNERHLQKFEKAARERGLSNEEAQAFVDAQAKEIADEVEVQKAEWLKQVENDPDIGGEKLPATVELAKRGMQKFFPDLAAELDRSGYGNHPAVLKGFAQIGKQFGEDTLVTGQERSSGEVPLEEKFYGKG